MNLIVSISDIKLGKQYGKVDDKSNASLLLKYSMYGDLFLVSYYFKHLFSMPVIIASDYNYLMISMTLSWVKIDNFVVIVI